MGITTPGKKYFLSFYFFKNNLVCPEPITPPFIDPLTDCTSYSPSKVI